MQVNGSKMCPFYIDGIKIMGAAIMLWGVDIQLSLKISSSSSSMFLGVILSTKKKSSYGCTLQGLSSIAFTTIS